MQPKRLKTYLLTSVLNHNQVLLLSVLVVKDLEGYNLSNPFHKVKEHLNMLSSKVNALMYIHNFFFKCLRLFPRRGGHFLIAHRTPPHSG